MSTSNNTTGSKRTQSKSFPFLSPLIGHTWHISMTNSLICHLYRVVVAEATRCGDGERGASGERVTFCCRREGRRQDTEKGGKTQMERERVKRCRWEPEMIRAPPPPLSLSNRKRLCNAGSLLTGMSKHPQIAIEGREDRLAHTH